MAVLGLRFCAKAFSSCGERGPLFIAVRGPLTITASPVAEHRLQTRRLSNCGSWAQLLRSMWDLPGPGLEPVFPALAGRLSTTAPPGKPLCTIFWSDKITETENMSGLQLLSRRRSWGWEGNWVNVEGNWEAPRALELFPLFFVVVDTWTYTWNNINNDNNAIKSNRNTLVQIELRKFELNWWVVPMA